MSCKSKCIEISILHTIPFICYIICLYVYIYIFYTLLKTLANHPSFCWP